MDNFIMTMLRLQRHDSMLLMKRFLNNIFARYNSLSERQFSIFVNIRSEEKPVRSNLFNTPGKRTGKGRVKVLYVAERSVTAKTKKHERNAEDRKYIGESKSETDMNILASDSSKSPVEMKDIIGPSVLKEDNLELFWNLSQGDPKAFCKLRTWQMRFDILSKIIGVDVERKVDVWDTIVKNSLHGNQRFVSYLFISSVKKRNSLIKKVSEYPKIDLLGEMENDRNHFDDPMCYHLFHNSLFMNIRPTTLKKLGYSRAMAAVLHGPELFIDCSYENYMNSVEQKFFSKQIIQTVHLNLSSSQPFHIVLCNFNKDSITAKHLQKYSPLFFASHHPVTKTSESYLNFCPRDRLVYLTPHCSVEMRQLEPDKRYIIGGFVDKFHSQRVSLAKAKENKIEMVKLPLDRYVDWSSGKKSLCVNHVAAILLSLKHSKNDWIKAFEVLPSRHFKTNGFKKQSNISFLVQRVSSLGSILPFERSKCEVSNDYQY